LWRQELCNYYNLKGRYNIKKTYRNPKDYNGKYNFVLNNCEDFTSTCFGNNSAPMKQTTKAAVVLVAIGTSLIVKKLLDTDKKV